MRLPWGVPLDGYSPGAVGFTGYASSKGLPRVGHGAGGLEFVGDLAVKAGTGYPVSGTGQELLGIIYITNAAPRGRRLPPGTDGSAHRLAASRRTA